MDDKFTSSVSPSDKSENLTFLQKSQQIKEDIKYIAIENQEKIFLSKHQQMDWNRIRDVLHYRDWTMIKVILISHLWIYT